MLSHVDTLKTSFAEVFADAHLSTDPALAQQYNPTQVAEQYRRVGEMQQISDLTDADYNFRFAQIRGSLPGAGLSALQQQENAFIEAGIQAHAIMAAAAAAIQYEQLHELHNRIIGERLRLHSYPRNLQQILAGFAFTLRDPHTNQTVTFAQAWDDLIGSMLRASSLKVGIDYRATEQPPVLGLHTAAPRSQDLPAPVAPVQMGLPQVPVVTSGPNGRQLVSRNLRVDVLDRGTAEANATRFVDLLRLQMEQPIVRHPYIRDFEDEARADGTIFTGVDYFRLDPVDQAKINWLRNKWEDQKKLTLRLRVPPGEYVVYPEGFRDRLSPGKANWEVPDDLVQKNITAYDFEIAESGQRVDVHPVFAVVEPSIRNLRPELALLDFRLGTNNQTEDLEGAFGGRMFQRFGKHLALQTQGEFEFRNHRDLLDLDRVLPAQFQPRQQRDLFDYSAREFQLDLGPVVRVRQFQFAVMQSLRWVKRDLWDGAGLVGQFFFNAGYLFKRGQVGFYGTKSNIDEPVVRRVPFDTVMTEETFLKVADQVGVNFQLGLSEKIGHLEGSVGYVDTAVSDAAAGGNVRWVLPLGWKNLAFTAEVGLNEGFVSSSENNLRVGAGLRLGSWGKPSEFLKTEQAVPVIVPRIRYETLTRVVRNGNRRPIAEAGADQIGVDWRKGQVILDCSGSSDPDGDSLSYQWTQKKGPLVALADANTAHPRFTPANGEEYIFELIVRDTLGLESEPDTVRITTLRIAQPKILDFRVDNAIYRKGSGCSTAQPVLFWKVEDAARVTISNTSIDRTITQKTDEGQVQVDPAATITYTLTAFNVVNESVTATVSVTVRPCLADIREFSATPPEIRAGEKSLLRWAVLNADRVVLTNKPGTLNATESPSSQLEVQPAQTTVYTLTAYNSAGEAASVDLTVTVKQALPEIRSLKADPPEIRVGDTSILSWDVRNAGKVTLTNGGDGGSTEVQGTGSLTVSPTKTTVYTLTAFNASGESTIASVTVTVKPPLPGIKSFQATPPEIGLGDSSTLSWSTESAARVTLTNGTSDAQVAANGTQVVKPNATTTYTLTACNAAGECATASVTVTVREFPVINSFRVNPAEIGPGESATLSWNVTGATRVTLTNGGEASTVNLTGSRTVSPPATTTYTLTACNVQGDCVTASATVTVKSYPVIRSFKASPAEIRIGQSSTLSWEVINASRVTLTNASASSDGTVGLNDNLTVSPRTTTTYTLTACNPAGDCVSSSVTVTVKPLLPGIVTFTATPSTIFEGNSSVLSWRVENASRVTLTNSVDKWNVQLVDALTVSPEDTTTYTLTAFNVAGEVVSAAVTVTVEGRPLVPVIDLFRATPSAISAGQCTQLSWATHGAFRVTLADTTTGTVQEVVASGSQQVCPGVTTAYILTAYNKAGDKVTTSLFVQVQ